jgi:hypothetical protein
VNPHPFAAELVNVAHVALIGVDPRAVASVVMDMDEADLRPVLHSLATLAGRLAYEIPESKRRTLIGDHAAYTPRA